MGKTIVTRVFSGLVLLGAIFAMVFGLVACNNDNDKSYLTSEQNATLNSTRVVPNTNNKVFEVNYTADYKVNEFIDVITDNMIYSASDCRLEMKKLLANDSSIVPSERLSNDKTGCSTVMCKNPDGVAMMGRNYDLDINSNGATIVLHTAPNGGYKSVGVADGAQFGISYKDLNNNTANKELLLYAPYFTMDGINEKGFACSIMILNEGSTIQLTDKKWLPSTLLVRYLLDNAESVENAIRLLEDKNFMIDYLIEPLFLLVNDISFHWAITDSTGDKAVIEYVDGEMIVNKFPLKVQYNQNDDTMTIQYPKEEKGYLISTNFYVSEGFKNTKGDSGKWRYETLENQLAQNPTPTKDELRDMMESVKYFMNDRDYIYYMQKLGVDTTKAENWDWITIWTDIMNTSDKTLTLYAEENYEVENTFNIVY